MSDREKVIREFEHEVKKTHEEDWDFVYLNPDFADKIIALLKEQEAMNVDAFVRWCIDSHIMGDATAMGIKYWVEKYKETKEGR